MKLLRLELPIIPPIPESGGYTCSFTFRGNQLIDNSSGENLIDDKSAIVSTIKDTGVILGAGASGIVKKFEHVYGDYVAVKTIRLETKLLRDQFRQELKVYDIFNNNDYLVHFYGCYLEESELNLVLEYMDQGSLKDIMTKHKEVHQNQAVPIPDDIIARILHDLVNGLVTLADSNFMHRDVKPQNVLLNSKGAVRLSDFGIVRLADRGKEAIFTTFVGTQMYMSPERIEGSEYNYNADVWSVGIIAYELATSVHPLANCKSFPDILMRVTNPIVPPAEATETEAAVSPLVADFISKCLTIDPANRPFPRDLLAHPLLEKACSKDQMSTWLGKLSCSGANRSSLRSRNRQRDGRQ